MLLRRFKIKHKNRGGRNLLFIMNGAICGNRQSTEQLSKWSYSHNDQMHHYQHLLMLGKFVLNRLNRKRKENDNKILSSVFFLIISIISYRDRLLLQRRLRIYQLGPLLLDRVNIREDHLNHQLSLKGQL